MGDRVAAHTVLPQQPGESRQDLVVHYRLPTHVTNEGWNMGNDDQLAFENLGVGDLDLAQLAKMANGANRLFGIHRDSFARASSTIATPELAPMRVAPAATIFSASW